ncbi:hypothetical protein OHA72_46365 [Dactylosporangium sp. NBC_01737]|uniref:hypothetical protein n=1 Tax=Dactylosporangium sp. NBC_01737 TaxID=2975959 RepID=UPI002E14C583|nr:hypothetical protein OHA72_46365 [Dactylosporangium sp. NBC_01737]
MTFIDEQPCDRDLVDLGLISNIHEVRSAVAIERQQNLVHCAFSFCWKAWFDHHSDQPSTLDTPSEPSADPSPDSPGERGLPPPQPALHLCWPKTLRAVRAWLTPWLRLQRWWKPGPTSPHPFR